MLDDAADRRSSIFEFIQRTNFGGVLIRHVLIVQRLRKSVWKNGGIRGRERESYAINPGYVALPIDSVVPFIGCSGVEPAICIADIAADEVAERTVVPGGHGSAMKNPASWTGFYILRSAGRGLNPLSSAAPASA